MKFIKTGLSHSRGGSQGEAALGSVHYDIKIALPVWSDVFALAFTFAKYEHNCQCLECVWGWMWGIWVRSDLEPSFRKKHRKQKTLEMSSEIWNISTYPRLSDPAQLFLYSQGCYGFGYFFVFTRFLWRILLLLITEQTLIFFYLWNFRSICNSQ